MKAAPMITMTEEDILRIFNARRPTAEEWRLVADAIAKRIEKDIDQGFMDEIDEMIDDMIKRKQG